MGLDKVKSEINRYAEKTSSTVQSVWDMYFFEHFLYRIAKSEYAYNFIFKGGFLLETILGIEMRSTTDIDLKANNIKLDNEQLKSVFEHIANIDLFDEIKYEVDAVEEIRKDSKYKGQSVKISAQYYNVRKSFTVDIAAGDVVTPNPIKLLYNSKINQLSFNILAYSKETILAEKFETLVSRGLNNSRAKDLLDIHLLVKEGYDNFVFNAAIINTFNERNTKLDKEIFEIVSKVLNSERIKELFTNYCKRHSFSKNITFEDCKNSIILLSQSIHLDDKIELKDIRITLVRHGQDETNKLGGWSNNKLIARGIEEVELLKTNLDDDYDLIICSDLPRTVETAKIIAENKKLDLIYNSSLREISNGQLADLTLSEFKEQYPGLYFSSLKIDEPYPGGESPIEFYSRVKEAFLKIVDQYKDKNILIVTHGGVITIIKCLVNGWEYSNLLKINIPTGSFIKL